MAVEKKPLEKNRNLLGQKQRKVSKSNKQICSPAYGNGPPLFPTGVKTIIFITEPQMKTRYFILQSSTLLRTRLYLGFKTFKSTPNPRSPDHQNPRDLHHHRCHITSGTKLKKMLKLHQQAGKHLCSIQEKPTSKNLDRGRLLWISMDPPLLEVKRLPPAKPKSMGKK